MSVSNRGTGEMGGFADERGEEWSEDSHDSQRGDYSEDSEGRAYRSEGLIEFAPYLGPDCDDTEPKLQNVRNNSWNSFLTLHQTNRVESYSDGFLAIVGTLMVVPLVHLSDDSQLEIAQVKGVTLQSTLTSSQQLANFSLFIGAFYMVVVLWDRHARLFQRLNKLDHFSVALNSLQLLFIATLPFTTGTASRFFTDQQKGTAESASFVALAINLFFLSALSFILAVATRRHATEGNLQSKMLVTELGMETFVSTVALILCSAGDGWDGPKVLVVYAFIPLSTFVYRLFASLHWDMNICSLLLRLHLPRSRIETFTDAVIAIAATLVILDMQPPTACHQIRDVGTCILEANQGCRFHVDAKFPGQQCSDGFFPISGSLGVFCAECFVSPSQFAESTGDMLGTFAVTFSAISLLWQQHAQLFQELDASRRPVLMAELLLNTLFCIFLSLLPFAFGLVWSYSLDTDYYNNEIPVNAHIELNPDLNAGFTACMFALLMLGGASSTLLLMRTRWICGCGSPSRVSTFPSGSPSTHSLANQTGDNSGSDQHHGSDSIELTPSFVNDGVKLGPRHFIMLLIITSNIVALLLFGESNVRLYPLLLIPVALGALHLKSVAWSTGPGVGEGGKTAVAGRVQAGGEGRVRAPVKAGRRQGLEESLLAASEQSTASKESPHKMLAE